MIVIYGIDTCLNPVKAAMSDVIHGCLRQVLGLPEDKRAHRFIPMRPSDFYFPGGRSEKYTVLEINMMSGRSEDTKKALIKALFSAFDSTLGIEAVDLEITIHEQPPHCWGFRGITGDEAKLNYPINI